MPRLAALPLLALFSAFAGPAIAQDSEPPWPQTVVVSATRHAMAQVDAPAAMTVVTEQQLAERGADNVLEAVRGETGISLIGRTISGRRNISLRGMDGRHTLFLVDGMRIGNTDGVVGHSDFQYDWVIAEEIERIEVVRGPMSVLYGAEALGGVVNIITRPPAERWAGRALLEGSWADGGLGGDGYRAETSVGGPLAERWRLGVSAAEVRRQAVRTLAEPRLSDLEGRDKQDGSVHVVWLPAAGQQVDLVQRIGQERRWADVRERSGPRRWHESDHDIARRHASLGWTGDWSGPWQVSSLLRAYASHVEVINTRTLGVAALRPQTLDDQVIEGQVALQPATGQRWSAGVESRRERLDNEALPGGQGAVGHRAVFAQAELAPGRTMAVTLGVRHDHHERFGDEWSPRAYAVWKPAPGWLVKGGVGHGYKAPTLKQNSAAYREDEGPNTYFGNAALVPETNDAADLGIGWDGQSLGAQAMVFDNRVRHLIVPRLFNTVAGRGQYVFENIDQARMKGLELEAHAGLAAGFRAGLNLTVLDARDGGGQRLEKRPRQQQGMQLDWSGGPWRAGLRVERQTGMLIAPTVVGQPMQALPDLTRVSAQVQRALGDRLSLSLGVDNLTALQLAEQSPLFTWAEAPRTWRLALRGQW